MSTDCFRKVERLGVAYCEVGGAFAASEASVDLLFELRHADIAPGLLAVEGDAGVDL